MASPFPLELWATDTISFLLVLRLTSTFVTAAPHNLQYSAFNVPLVKTWRCKTDGMCYKTLIACNRYVCWQVFTSRNNSMCESTLYYLSLFKKNPSDCSTALCTLLLLTISFACWQVCVGWRDTCICGRYFRSLSFLLIYLYIAVCSHHARAASNLVSVQRSASAVSSGV